jgi:hypothetical protein
MRFIIQLPVILGLCGLLWLSVELNAVWLDHQLFPATKAADAESSAQAIAKRLYAIRQELRDARSGTGAVLSATARQ